MQLPTVDAGNVHFDNDQINQSFIEDLVKVSIKGSFRDTDKKTAADST